MNDKFSFEVKEIEPKLKQSENWEQEISKFTDEEYEFLLLQMPPESAKLQRRHYLSNLHNKQNNEEFGKLSSRAEIDYTILHDG